MSPTVKKVAVLASAAGAVAATGGLAYVLKRRAPTRQAYRESLGWTPTTYSPAGKPMKPAPTISPTNPQPQQNVASNAKPIESADPNPKPGIIGAIKETYYEFANDDVMTQAAALAFYSGLAFAPLLTVAVWAAKVFFGSESKEKVAKAFGDVIGAKAAEPLKDLLDPASTHASAGMTVAGIVSIVLVIFSASGVFGQVQSALNAIWHVEAKPSNGLIGFIRKRFLSVGMLASILFLLMTSLVVSTVLQGVLGNGASEGAWAIMMSVMNNLISVALFTVLFAAMFKFVPDAKIDWKPVWIGGFLSALLFTAGKFGLAFYLGRGDYENSYGAAVGSFVALLVWVYYSSVILLVGAEATEVYARRAGHALQPDDYAVRVVKKTEA
ncbi:MAG TPA: YihY/virulence factor BrkB family protein [Tepidisphaeraceae bacterium]|jgi:membrane protein